MKTLTLAICLLVTSTSLAGIINGDFDNGLTGWNLTQAQFPFNQLSRVHDGYVSVAGYSNGPMGWPQETLSQTFTVTQPEYLSFDYGWNFQAGTYVWGGITINGPSFFSSVSDSVSDGSLNRDWTHYDILLPIAGTYSIEVTTQGRREHIGPGIYTGYSANVFLDNVTVAVPEPTGFILGLLACVGFWWIKR